MIHTVHMFSSFSILNLMVLSPMTRKRGSGYFVFWSFIYRLITNIIIMILVYVYATVIHKPDSAEHINSMSDLLFTILIFASVMVVTLPCYWLYLVVEVANLDNSVSDRDIQSFLESGDLQSLQELKEFGFDIILDDNFMTLMLDMNDIDIAFPHALSLIDCWLPMLHIIQIPRIMEYILNNARRYEQWKNLTIQQRSQEILSGLRKMQQHYFKNNSTYEFMTFIQQNSMQIMLLCVTSDAYDFISDNLDRNNKSSWWSIDKAIHFIDDVRNQGSVGCDTLYYFVEEHLNDEKSAIWKDDGVWKLYVKMFEYSWNDIKNFNIKAFVSVNTRKDYLYSKLLTFVKLFGKDKMKTILKSKDIMLFIMMFDNDFIVDFLSNQINYDIKQAFKIDKNSGGWMKHFTTEVGINKLNAISLEYFNQESAFVSRMGLSVNEFDRSFEGMSDGQAYDIFSNCYKSLTYGYYRWAVYSKLCQNLYKKEDDNPSKKADDTIKYSTNKYFKSLISKRFFVTIQTDHPKWITHYFKDPARHICTILHICCEIGNKEQIAHGLREIIDAIELGDINHVDEYKENVDLYDCYKNKSILTDVTLDGRYSVELLMNTVTNIFPIEFCPTLLNCYYSYPYNKLTLNQSFNLFSRMIENTSENSTDVFMKRFCILYGLDKKRMCDMIHEKEMKFVDVLNHIADNVKKHDQGQVEALYGIAKCMKEINVGIFRHANQFNAALSKIDTILEENIYTSKKFNKELISI